MNSINPTKLYIVSILGAFVVLGGLPPKTYAAQFPQTLIAQRNGQNSDLGPGPEIICVGDCGKVDGVGYYASLDPEESLRRGRIFDRRGNKEAAIYELTMAANGFWYQRNRERYYQIMNEINRLSR